MSDAIARDFVILASHLRRAAHSIDSLLAEMRMARVRSPVRGAGADVEDFVSITGEADRPSQTIPFWIDERYGNEVSSAAGVSEADAQAQAEAELRDAEPENPFS